MAHQVAVTVRATVLDGHRHALEALLRVVRQEGPAGQRFPFGELEGTHFARLFVLDGFTAPDGAVVADSLLYMADVDGRAGPHLRDLVRRAPVGLDEAFGHCVGYPASPSDGQRLTWLQERRLRPAAYYVHTVGRTLPQIHGEAALHDELADLIDDPAAAGADPRPVAVRRSLLQVLAGRPSSAWAVRRAQGPGRCHLAKEAVHAVAVPLMVLPALPVLLPLAVLGLLVLRVKEQTDWADSGPADPVHVSAVEAYEDVGAQNAFTAAGQIKPGRVRGTTMRVALFGLDYACRHLFNTDNLAGVRTIHFARWQPLDDGRRVLFASSYDGSQESYMDDFIDRLSWGVNLVFSNGVGYPRTRWLLLRGARDEVSYKQYLRKHQVPTVVFYSGYAQLPAQSIDTNSRIRDGLARSLDEREAARWLASL